MVAALAVALLLQTATAPGSAPHLVQTETRRIESAVLGETRIISVYRPPTAPAGPLPVVYIADGQMTSWVAGIVAPEMAAGALPPAVIVGVHSTDNEGRGRDYLLNFRNGGDAAFARHEQFLLHEVMPLVEREFGASYDRARRCVMGVSNGAAWAVATASRNPEVFGCAAGLAFGWSQAASFSRRGPRMRLFLGAGRKDPNFLRESERAAALAREAGQEVRFTTAASGHDQATWAELYPKAFAWALR